MTIITGQATANPNKSIADSLATLGEAEFPPIDPLSRERIRQSQFENASRAKALQALQRGDMTEYFAQSVLAHQSAVDAMRNCRE